MQTMLARIFPARGVFAGARAVTACRARSAHAHASGKTSDNALTIQKMSTAEWAEAFKKVRVHTGKWDTDTDIETDTDTDTDTDADTDADTEIKARVGESKGKLAEA